MAIDNDTVQDTIKALERVIGDITLDNAVYALMHVTITACHHYQYNMGKGDEESTKTFMNECFDAYAASNKFPVPSRADMRAMEKLGKQKRH